MARRVRLSLRASAVLDVGLRSATLALLYSKDSDAHQAAVLSNKAEVLLHEHHWPSRRHFTSPHSSLQDMPVSYRADTSRPARQLPSEYNPNKCLPRRRDDFTWLEWTQSTRQVPS